MAGPTQDVSAQLTRCPSPACRLPFGVGPERVGAGVSCPRCGLALTVKPAAIWAVLDQREQAFGAGNGARLRQLDAPLSRGAGSPLLRQRLYHRPSGDVARWLERRWDLQYEAARDQPEPAADALESLVGVLDDLRSQWNAGAIFRTAEGAGWGGLLLCGTTPVPPASGVTRVSLGAERQVAWRYRAEVLGALGDLTRAGYTAVALEQTRDAVALDRFDPPARMALVIGNEVGGVSREALAVCEQRVCIPMAGCKASLNVAVAFGVAAFTLRQRWLARHRPPAGAGSSAALDG